MRFDRLRLHGFKSFVDPTDLIIRAGLTGVVGPNGCGKSNLLEALRWVMGENRPTAMRGEGMEDVIFAGTTRRSARAQAQVALSIDNRDRLAPAGFNDHDGLEIIRRITRDAGSAYRINGREVRARDVQMLFADASTGAHSPALVRQGQISELINARPRSRRRILEEAAGISGLYQRRHEAELRLNGAETNLTRVDDTLDQLTLQVASLARQARAAARYRELGAALRWAEGMLLHRRWLEADGARQATDAALTQASRTAELAEATARDATGRRAQTEDQLPALRDEDQIARALLSHLSVEAEALEGAATRAAADLAAMTDRIAQLDRDIEREAQLNNDAAEVVARLTRERADLDHAGKGQHAALDEAGVRADQVAEALHEVEVRFSQLTDEAARLTARHQSASRLVADLCAQQDRATAAAKVAEQAVTNADAAGLTAQAALTQAQGAQDAARDGAEAAEDALADAEQVRAVADGAEAAARAARSTAQGELAALSAEMAALRRLVERGQSGGMTLLDHVQVTPGAEAAFGAALGDDLNVGLIQNGGSGWHHLPAFDKGPSLPQECEALAPLVSGPAALARRMSQVGLVGDADKGQALQADLAPGQRLVTRAGDLFRWDGLRVMAGAAVSAAALHLQKVNRLAAISDQATLAEDRAGTATAAHEQARTAQGQAAAAEAAARDARRQAERHLSEVARAATRAITDLAMASSRAELARAELARHQFEADAAGGQSALAVADLHDLPDRDLAAQAVDHACLGVEAARIATMSRRAALDEMRRDIAARTRRLTEIEREDAGWAQRLQQAGARAAELAHRRQTAGSAMADLQGEPAALARRRASLSDRQAKAQDRAHRASEALLAGDLAARADAEAERDAARAVAQAREAQAACIVRTEAARDHETAARARILDETDKTPDALRAALEGGDRDTDASAATLEDRITRLRGQRDALGAVNLRADEDKRALEVGRDRLAAEKTDLEQAIAKLRLAIGSLNREGRERLLAAFETVNTNFATLFTTLFGGGEARLMLVESDDPLEAGLEIMCQPPGKKLSTLSLLSGGEQTLTAMALIFAVFLANPAPICVLDEVDAPLDDANVSRFCDLLDEMTRRTDTRFLIITHHAVTMSRMDRLFGVTMVEPGVSQLVSVDLKKAEALVA